jgi:hypothetical protein
MSLNLQYCSTLLFDEGAVVLKMRIGYRTPSKLVKTVSYVVLVKSGMEITMLNINKIALLVVRSERYFPMLLS